MPLEKHIEIYPQGELAVWEVTETDEFFLEQMPLYRSEEEEIINLSSRKKSEWLSSRYLLHLLSGRVIRGACLKNRHGKPYLQGSDHYISISHTQNRVGVIASRNACGIDIQVIVSKITRIAHKFCNEHEKEYIDKDREIEYLHVIWGAKESIYKAYGKRNIDFKKDMLINGFEILKDHSFKTTGILVLENEERTFYVKGKIIENYVLVYALEMVDDSGVDMLDLLQTRK